jgi:hypothetical protein
LKKLSKKGDSSFLSDFQVKGTGWNRDAHRFSSGPASHKDRKNVLCTIFTSEGMSFLPFRITQNIDMEFRWMEERDEGKNVKKGFPFPDEKEGGI